MTTKERLHKLVDELSEREADEALRLIAARREGDFANWLDAVPEEDEEISEDDTPPCGRLVTRSPPVLR
jgi:hypothetical protein